MLTHTQNLGYRAAEFSISPLPEAEKNQTLKTLRHYYGEASQSLFVPHDKEDELRLALQEASPTLAKLGEELRERLDQDYSLMLIKRTWINHLELDTRSALLFALSLSMGSPTPTDQVDKKVVWDIRALGDKMEKGHVPTFSEHAYEAELHTDTQYYKSPERFMLLYYNHPAQCGGGLSYCRDITSIKEEMSKTQDGRWALDVLETEELPFRIPMTFTSDGSQNAEEVTFAPILGQRPHIRYRKDTLERGFKLHPEKETPHVKKALNIFTQELFKPEPALSAFVERDSMLALNNHECLHGRSEFSDPERHAFRIRIAAQQDQHAV